MNVVVRQAANAVILDLSGQFTRGEPVESFRTKIHELISSGTRNFAINLADVPYLDSSAIGALMGAVTSTEAAGGRCKFFSAPETILALLKTFRLNEVFEIHPDEPTALASFPA